MKNATSLSISCAHKRCYCEGKALNRDRKQDISLAGASLPFGTRRAILYLSAREVEVGIIVAPGRGASLTVCQPGFVITAREVMWSL